jgi:hypothetical protein
MCLRKQTQDSEWSITRTLFHNGFHKLSLPWSQSTTRVMKNRTDGTSAMRTDGSVHLQRNLDLPF